MRQNAIMVVLAVFIGVVLMRFWPALTEDAPVTTDPDYAIDYVEFSSADLAASRRFFESAFGWTFTEYGPDYVAFESGGLAGGFAVGKPTIDPAGAPLIILKVANLELAQVAVQSARGDIVEPIFAFPGGRRFHFREPGGNILAVWSQT